MAIRRGPIASWAVCVAAISIAPLHADTVTLANGKKLEGVVVSKNDDTGVIVNPWRSRHPDMTFEIPDANVLARAKVKDVVVAEPPEVEYRMRAAKPGLGAQDHFELSTFCAEHGMKAEAAYHLEQAVVLDPAHEAALAAYGATKLQGLLTRNSNLTEQGRALERRYVDAKTDEEAKAALAELEALATKPRLAYLERARRSAQLPKGRRDKVALTVDSEKVPGANYCIYVPKSYDALRPTPLVVGLHGGGAGGADDTLVTGSGEEAMNFYVAESEKYGCIVVCPTALAAPWRKDPNEAWLRALLDEMTMRFNVDRTRVYLVGHSMGGFGAWDFGPRWPDVWAAYAPCAGGGGGRSSPEAAGVPVYCYHGTDDPIVGVESDRQVMRQLLGDGKKKPKLDFVYTELNGVGHGFPDWVRDDIFRWFGGRTRPHSKKGAVGPDSSFDAKPSKREIALFGDPEQPFKAAGAHADDPKELLAALKVGGQRGADARDALAKLDDDAIAKQVATLLKSNKSSVDTRVLAAETLGAMGRPSCVALLAPGLDDEDWRVLHATITGLGKIASTDCVPLLARASKRLVERFEGSKLNGNQLMYVEYDTRLAGFAAWCDAAARIDAAKSKDVLLQLADADLVATVFAPKTPYVTPDDDDPRFATKTTESRRKLVKSLCAVLEHWQDPRGVATLQRTKERWTKDAQLIAACDATIAALGG
ncbi:MAG: HEAT repeat domain-containing protein [Planctomycetes bacterium]|nr:HEAT repeat domain-containing protein [Planctomycetota bacterium]